MRRDAGGEEPETRDPESLGVTQVVLSKEVALGRSGQKSGNPEEKGQGRELSQVAGKLHPNPQSRNVPGDSGRGKMFTHSQNATRGLQR